MLATQNGRSNPVQTSCRRWLKLMKTPALAHETSRKVEAGMIAEDGGGRARTPGAPCGSWFTKASRGYSATVRHCRYKLFAVSSQADLCHRSASGPEAEYPPGRNQNIRRRFQGSGNKSHR